jgi:hypothetical protein
MPDIGIPVSAFSYYMAVAGYGKPYLPNALTLRRKK